MKFTILGLVMLLAVARAGETIVPSSNVTSTAPPPPPPTTTTTKTPKTNATTTAPSPAPQPNPEPEPVVPHEKANFPAAVTFNVTVKDASNVTCLKVTLAAQFVLLNVSNVVEYLNLEHAVRSEPNWTCADVNVTSIPLKLSFGKNDVTFNFERDVNGISSWLDSITLNYVLVNETEAKHHVTLKQKLFESNGTAFRGKNYFCKAETATQVVDDVKVVFKEVSVEVGSSPAGQAPDVTKCVTDDDVNDMIPIAVGAALLALVAIVLVAYFVGRRRSRRLAYQSV